MSTSSVTSSISGLTIPTHNFTNSVIEDFPTTNRIYKVESGILARYFRDSPATNTNLTSGLVNDSYLEFIINSSEQEFFDCKSLSLELKVKITKADGGDLPDNASITLVDGFAHRLLSRSSVFLNSTPCESNAFFGLYNTLKSYLSLGKSSLDSDGRNMYYKSLDTKSPKTFNAPYFVQANLPKDEKEIINDVKGIIHTVCPINLDISDANFYLLNGVNMRIRFDLAPASVLLNTIDDENYKYQIQTAKLWVQKIVPQPAALLSLNRHLITKNTSIEYIFQKPLIRSYVLPSGQISLQLDNIFNNVVPHYIYLFAITQKALSGAYTHNAAHFYHCNINNLRLDVNGNTISTLNGSFPNQISTMFNHTLRNIYGNDHLLTYDLFKEGRTIFAFDLRSSESADVLNVEKSGNLRISLECAEAPNENVAVFVIGITTGLIEIDGNRRVSTNYLL